MAEQVYEYEVFADAEFIDDLNESLNAIAEDEDSYWSFHHVKLNGNELFVSTWNNSGEYLRILFEVSNNHPSSIVVSNLTVVPSFDRAPQTDEDYRSPLRMSSLIVEGRVVSEKFLNDEDKVTGRYDFKPHQHTVNKEGNPSEKCLKIHYGYIFHLRDTETGETFVFSHKSDPNEGWNDYYGLDQIVAYERTFDPYYLTGKSFLMFAESEAELLLMETRERARVGQFMLHPICHKLNTQVLHQLFENDEAYLHAESSNGGIFWSTHQAFHKMSQQEWKNLVISFSDLLQHD